jgi:HSP20 family protein
MDRVALCEDVDAASGNGLAPRLEMTMRYRHLRYRYTLLYSSGQPRQLGDVLWRAARMTTVMAQSHWHPDTDVSETPTAIAVTIDVAAVAEDDVEIQLFEDALVVEGQRRLPACEETAVYHAVAIRQGPFRVEVPLPVAVDPDRVEARYERGLLSITLPKARKDGSAS